ncbi:hypothetical protein V5F40_21530 [Xanthobacter sp. DSM 14520]|uniref:hypothetical protein n=1 Tax=Xanthobacter autotrophicus (strain ATCC BAA-1158 / Py2) TaxID=78245 RepID=UPI003727E406
MQRWFDFHPDARLDLVHRADGVPLTRLRLREPATEEAQARALLAGWVAYDNGCDFDHYGDIKSTKDYAELLAPFFPPERIRMALTSDPSPSNLDLHTQDLASNYRAARHHLEAAVLALSAAGDTAAAAAVRELFSGLRIPGQEQPLVSQVDLRSPRDALDEYREGALEEVTADVLHWGDRELNRLAAADVQWEAAEIYGKSAGELVAWLEEIFNRSGFANTADGQQLQELKTGWHDADRIYAEAVSSLVGGVDEDAVLTARDIAFAARQLDRFVHQLVVSRRDVIEGLDELAVRMEEWLPPSALPGGTGMLDKIRERDAEVRKVSAARDGGPTRWRLTWSGEELLLLATKLERQLNQAGGVLQLGQKDAREGLDSIVNVAYELDRAGAATPLTGETWQLQVDKLDKLLEAGLFRAAQGKEAGDALAVDAALAVVGQLLDVADKLGSSTSWEFLARRCAEVAARLAARVPGLEETSKTIGRSELSDFNHVFSAVGELLTLPTGPATEGANHANEVAKGIEELTSGAMGSLSGAELRRLADLMGTAAQCITAGDFMMRELRSGDHLAKPAADLDDVLPHQDEAGSAAEAQATVIAVETTPESVLDTSSVARQVAGVPDWKRQDILRKVEAARQAMGFTKGPGTSPEVTPFEGGAIPLWRRLMVHHDAADATRAICYGLDALRRGSRVFPEVERRLIAAADGREDLSFFGDAASHSVQELIGVIEVLADELHEVVPADRLWLKAIEEFANGLPFTALDGIIPLPDFLSKEVLQFVGLTDPVPGRAAPLRVVDATIPRTLVQQTRQRAAICLTAMQEQLGFAGEGGLSEMFGGQAVQVIVARQVDLTEQSAGNIRHNSRGQAAVVRLSPYKGNAAVHEFAHAIDLMRPATRQERYGLMAEHGVMDSARRIFAEAAPLLLGEERMAERASYYLSPEEVFARTIALTISERVREAGVEASSGGWFADPAGFEYEPAQPARDAFFSALREDFARRRELDLGVAPPEPAPAM